MNNTTGRKNYFTLDLAKSKIYGTKAVIKRANTGHGPEYENYMELIAAHPTFTLEVKVMEKHTTEPKKTYKGITYSFIENYISIKPEHEALYNEYKAMRTNAVKVSAGEYQYARKWFLTRFSTSEHPFNIDEAKEEIFNFCNAKAKEEALNPKVQGILSPIGASAS